jgi:tRNA U38,U39,U40 pseudouridine synthase TruA
VEHIASIFRVEKISSARNQRESRWYSYSHYTALCPEDCTLHNHCCKNLKSYKVYNVLYLVMVFNGSCCVMKSLIEN